MEEKKMIKLKVFDMAFTNKILGKFLIKNVVKYEFQDKFLVAKCREDDGKLSATYIAKDDIQAFALPSTSPIAEGENRYLYEVLITIKDGDGTSVCRIGKVIQDNINDDYYIPKELIEFNGTELICNDHYIEKDKILKIEKLNFVTTSFAPSEVVENKKSLEDEEK